MQVLARPLFFTNSLWAPHPCQVNSISCLGWKSYSGPGLTNPRSAITSWAKRVSAGTLEGTQGPWLGGAALQGEGGGGQASSGSVPNGAQRLETAWLKGTPAGQWLKDLVDAADHEPLREIMAVFSGQTKRLHSRWSALGTLSTIVILLKWRNSYCSTFNYYLKRCIRLRDLLPRN